jgi:cation-transporting ATPase E
VLKERVVGDLDGLDEGQVQERVARGDVNDVPPLSSRTVWQIVRANVFTPFNALLGGLLAVILVVGPLQDALFGGVLVANAAIGIVQELRAKRTLDRLTVLTAPRARAVRSGQMREIPVAQVVMDDVLELRPGDQVVVDGEILAAEGLEIDESLLTGESDPVAKRPGNEVLSGSFVVAGAGRYRATRVGAAAYARSLAEEARAFTLARSELRTGINRIVVLVAWFLLPTAALLTYSQFRSNLRFADSVRGAVAGVVAMVPEGLVLLTSIAFAVAVVRLGRRKVLVQELQAVEGLAQVDVLSIDKTGTLTEGRLVVEGVEELSDGDRELVAFALGALARAEPNPNATLRAIGDAYSPRAVEWIASARIPFSSARKWSASSFDGHGTWVLGAPDVLLEPTARAERSRADSLAEQGRRVLLLERTAAAVIGDELPRGRVPLALVMLRDRVREDAPATLQYFSGQGITIKVISGDNPHTAASVASQVGLPGAEHAVDGRELPADPAGLRESIEGSFVFGRVSPRQKQSMVRALQANGHVVAMTGDGVNDVLALKDADIGIAMGSGSDASRAAAKLVLLDARFASLPAVVAEGRRVLANIERTAKLFVTKSVYAMLLAIGVGALGFPFPFLPRHLTLVGALTIGIPGFVLTFERDAPRAQPGFTRRVLRFAVPAGVMASLTTFVSYLWVYEGVDRSLAEGRTAATMTLFLIGMAIFVIAAHPLSRTRAMTACLMVAAFAAILLIPMMRTFFELQMPPARIWLAAVGIAVAVAGAAHLATRGHLNDDRANAAPKPMSA